MKDILAIENAETFQEVLREFHVDSLQGWQEVGDVEVCHQLLTVLSERCGAYIRVESVNSGQGMRALESVDRSGDQLTVWARDLEQSGRPYAIRFHFRLAAVGRFAIVLLGNENTGNNGTQSDGTVGVAAVLWHTAFRLTPDHIREFVRHFS